MTNKSNTAFIHTGLATRYRRKSF